MQRNESLACPTMLLQTCFLQVRILVKVIPQSMPLVAAGPEGGGNNRISEEQIKCGCTASV